MVELGLARQGNWDWNERLQKWRLGLARRGEGNWDKKPGVRNRLDLDRDRLKETGQKGSNVVGRSRTCNGMFLLSANNCDTPQAKCLIHFYWCSTENDNLLLLSVNPSVQMAEICAMDLKIPTLFKTHVDTSI